MINRLDVEDQKSIVKIINILSNLCFVVMAVLAISPIVGIYIPTHHSIELSNLFYAKALIVKVTGLTCLALGAFSLIMKIFLYGRKYVFETLIKNPWNILFILMLIWMAISIKEVNPLLRNTTFFGWAYTYEGFIAWIAYAGIYLGMSSIRTNKQKRIILNLILGAAMVVAICTLLYEKGISEYMFFRANMCLPYSGSFINPNHYAYYLCVICILSASAIFITDNKKWRLFYIVSFFINTAVLCLNNSFGSYLALLVGMIFFNFWFLKDKKYRFYTLSMDLVFVVLTVCLNIEYITVELTGFFQGIVEFIVNYINGGNASEAMSDVSSVTANGRSVGWSTALKLIGDHPLFGVGPDMEHEAFVFKYGVKTSSHNWFFYVADCSGIPALVLYTSALISVFVKCFRKLKTCSNLEKVFMLAFGTFIVSSCFGISMPVSDFIFFMMLGFINSFFAKEKEIKCLE